MNSGSRSIRQCQHTCICWCVRRPSLPAHPALCHSQAWLAAKVHPISMDEINGKAELSAMLELSLDGETLMVSEGVLGDSSLPVQVYMLLPQTPSPTCCRGGGDEGKQVPSTIYPQHV